MRKLGLAVKSKDGNAEERAARLREARTVRWKELLCILEHLEKELGWQPFEGSQAYGHQEHKSSKQCSFSSSLLLTLSLSVVLGEGFRNREFFGQAEK